MKYMYYYYYLVCCVSLFSRAYNINNSFDNKKSSLQSAHGKVFLSPLTVAAPLHVFSCLRRDLYSDFFFAFSTCCY